MLTRKQKLKYIYDSIKRYNSQIKCPSCGAEKYKLVDRKYIFTRLFECQDCFLNFRHPYDNEKTNLKFYQSDYVEGDGITTMLPNKKEIEQLKSENFNKSIKNNNQILEIFSTLFKNLKSVKLVDYGSSWGYMSYQFIQAGLNVQSYDISKIRAKFGNENLGLNILTDENKIIKNNDIFFSSHVIEHVPNVSKMLTFGKSCVSKNGYVITTCPNGSLDFKHKKNENFHRSWGKVHPNLLSAKFFQNLYSKNPFYITSAPNYKSLSLWDKKTQFIDKELTGDNIFVIACPNVFV